MRIFFTVPHEREAEKYIWVDKESIDKYVSALTNELQDPKEQKDLKQTKFKMLKRIIEHYDIKNMQKNDYSKLIKTFGLKIQTAKTSQKKTQSRMKNRNFTIKSTSRNTSRLSKLTSKLENDSQVAFIQFSKQYQPDQSQTKQPLTSKSTRSRMLDNEKISPFQKTGMSKRFQSSTSKSKRLQIKKITPFKYQSRQDVITEKVNKYRQFLFVLNMSNGMYRMMELKQYQIPLKFYVGKGNNSNLIKSLMKKRFWFDETNKIKQANFVWTQLKIQSIFDGQKPNKKKGQFHEEEKSCKLKKKGIAKLITVSPTIFEESFSRVLSKKDFQSYLKMNEALSRKTNIEFSEKIKYCLKKIDKKSIKESDRVHNHLSSNGLLGNKKGLFYSLREYYKLKSKNVFDILPVTFHITKGILDDQFKSFMNLFQERKREKRHNVWIMKPGQFSNRGQGISCSNRLDDIKKRVMKCKSKNDKKGEQKTLILQLYITNPLLYNNRKFDVRVFMLTTIHNGKIKAYWYQQGYIRTSSYSFDLNEITNNDIHLTNDAIQKQSQRYGKYQPANKLSFNELQRYLDSLGRNLDLNSMLIPKMKQIAAESIKSSFLFLDPERKQHNFEIFGLDFMVDYNFKPWLIQINTNPCLELSCPLLQRIIPHMLENALRIGLDPLFPPTDNVPHNYKYTIAENAAIYNKFQLIFDEQRDGYQTYKLYESNQQSVERMTKLLGIEEDKQQYEEEGILDDYDV